MKYENNRFSFSQNERIKNHRLQQNRFGQVSLNGIEVKNVLPEDRINIRIDQQTGQPVAHADIFDSPAMKNYISSLGGIDQIIANESEIERNINNMIKSGQLDDSIEEHINNEDDDLNETLIINMPIDNHRQLIIPPRKYKITDPIDHIEEFNKYADEFIEPILSEKKYTETRLSPPAIESTLRSKQHNNLCILGCGEIIPSNAKFCPSCGGSQAKQNKYCVNCGEPFQSKEKFCSECGQSR